MQNFVTFIGDMIALAQEVLMSEPLVYFVGLLLLCFIIGAFRKLIRF